MTLLKLLSKISNLFFFQNLNKIQNKKAGEKILAKI
jgi:hypothetical protein